MSKDVKFIIMKRYITTILIVIFFNTFCTGTAFGGEKSSANTEYTTNIKASNSEEQVLELINEEREKEGKTELKFDSRLMKLAKLKVEDMLNENYISHNSDKYGDVFQMLSINNVDYSLAGENIARNVNEKSAVNAWMNSENHRNNILEDRYEYTGISVVKDKTYGYIFVQIFAEI